MLPPRGHLFRRVAAPLGRLAAALLLLASAPRPAAADADPCDLSSADLRWIQGALDGWSRVSTEVLGLDSVPRTWMVFYDRSCAWHLASGEATIPGARPADPRFTLGGEPVPVRVREHVDEIWLPGGRTMPVREAAQTFPYEREDGHTAAAFLLALPEVWRERRPVDQYPRLEATMMGVASHELVHTVQLPHVVRRFERLEERYELPEDVGDDVVEERFGDDSIFRDAYTAETDLFYRAVSEADEGRARALADSALERVRARERARFTGEEAVFRELDALFLNMEDVAVWAAYRLSRLDPAYDIGIDDPAEDRARNSWSQDRGLALFLLIDRWMDGWKERALSPEVPSPYVLLEEALDRRR